MANGAKGVGYNFVNFEGETYTPPDDPHHPIHIPDAKLSALDLDDCRDRANPECDGLPRELHARLAALETYCDFSPSGSGVHVFGTASDATPLHRTVPMTGTKHAEIYHRPDTGRFMTITGMPIPSLFHDRLGDLSPLSLELVKNRDGARKTKARAPNGRSPKRAPSTDLGERFRQAAISPELEVLIREGVPVRQRSEKFHRVVCELRDLGWEVDEIEEHLAAFPRGIAEKYGGRLGREVRRCYGKERVNGHDATDESAEGADESEGADETESAEGKDEGDGANESSGKSESRSDDDAPIPLNPQVPDQARYPLESIGALTDGTRAIARQVQVPVCIAAQSALAVASLAAQAIGDVKLPITGDGQVRPLSLYFVSVAQPSDRKSTSDNIALRPTEQRETKLREIYEEVHEEWRKQHAAWLAQKRSIEMNRKLSRKERYDELNVLGVEPPAPTRPILRSQDLTVQGLVKSWVTLPSSFGLFSAEGGIMTGGYGFSPEQRLATGASLSNLWDGKDPRRLRAGDEQQPELRGRRLCAHLMLPPKLAASFLGDEILRGQGFRSRLLIAAPPSLAGNRLFKEPDPDCDRAIRTYAERVLRVFEAWPFDTGELKPRPLEIRGRARALWVAFHDKVEVDMRANGPLAELKDVAGKMAEQAARIAGVLTLVANPAAEEIPAETMADAIELAGWYLGEAARLIQAPSDTPSLQAARMMLEWLHGAGKTTITIREAMRNGPHRLRTKAAVTGAFRTLEDHNWLKPDRGYTRWKVVQG
jgi:hypothetical protein